MAHLIYYQFGCQINEVVAASGKCFIFNDIVQLGLSLQNLR